MAPTKTEPVATPANREFVSKVSSLPMAQDAVAAVNNVVETVSGASPYAKHAIDKAGAVAETAVKATKPVQDRFATQLTQLDAQAAALFDLMLAHYPILKSPTSELVDSCRQIVFSARQRISQPATTAYDQLNVHLITIVNHAGDLVDRVLPDDEAEQQLAKDGDNLDNAGARAVHVVSVAHKRTVKALMLRATSLMEMLPESSDLLKLEGTNSLVQRANETIAQINEKVSPLVQRAREQVDVERLHHLQSMLLSELDNVRNFLLQSKTNKQQANGNPDDAAGAGSDSD